jgi:hypothetical protein
MLTKVHTSAAVSTSSNTVNCPSSNFGIAVTDPAEMIPIPGRDLHHHGPGVHLPVGVGPHRV